MFLLFLCFFSLLIIQLLSLLIKLIFMQRKMQLADEREKGESCAVLEEILTFKKRKKEAFLKKL